MHQTQGGAPPPQVVGVEQKNDAFLLNARWVEQEPGSSASSWEQLMLIPVRCRNEAAADRGKNDEARQNYNNMGCPGHINPACAGWLWRQLDRAGQHGQRSTDGHLPHAVLRKLVLALFESNAPA